MRSSLANLLPTSPMNDGELFNKKRIAWVEESILVVTPEQMAKLGNKEHEVIINVGNKLYKGKINGKN
jgi:hypothetical protein